MSTRKNSAPFAFRTFSGRQPTTEELRSDVERMYLYLQVALDGLLLTDLKGSLSSSQAPDLVASITALSAKIDALNTTLTASITTLSKQVNDVSTGLPAAFVAIAANKKSTDDRIAALNLQVQQLLAKP